MLQKPELVAFLHGSCTIYKVLYNWPNETIDKEQPQTLRTKEVRLTRTNENKGFKVVQINREQRLSSTKTIPII